MAPRPSMVCPHNNENWSMSHLQTAAPYLKNTWRTNKKWCPKHHDPKEASRPKRLPGTCPKHTFLRNLPPAANLPGTEKTNGHLLQQSSETRTSPLSVSPSFALQPCSTGAEGSPSFGGVDTISAIHGFVIATEGRQFQVCHRQAFHK